MSVSFLIPSQTPSSGGWEEMGDEAVAQGMRASGAAFLQDGG